LANKRCTTDELVSFSSGAANIATGPNVRKSNIPRGNAFLQVHLLDHAETKNAKVGSLKV
jgi:hypothetical protein